MLRVIKIIFAVALLIAVVGTLGLSIASFVTVLNIQDTINAQFNTPDAAAPTSTIAITTTTAPAGPETMSTTPESAVSTATVEPAVTSSEVATSTTPIAPTTTVNTIPDPEPIETADPRYDTYKGMSQLLSSWMNRSVNPCDDFYEYTCGAGKRGQDMSFDVTDDQITESMLSKLRQPESNFATDSLPIRQTKWFYDACMAGADDGEKAARSARIFNDLRAANDGFGFPALFPAETAAATPEQLGAFLGYALGSSGLPTLVDAGVDTDWRDPHNAKGGYSLLLDQPAPLFVSTFYTKMYPNFADEIVDGIVNTINRAALLLNIGDVDQQQARRDAVEVAQLDFDLATKYSSDDTTRREYARSYNPYTVDALQKLAPFINWNTFLTNCLAPISKTVDDSFRSIVMEVEKLSLLSADVASGAISQRAVNNYLYLRALNSLYLPPLPKAAKTSSLNDFLRPIRRINRKIRQEPKPDPLTAVADFTKQEASCQSSANNYLMWASTRLYVDANYKNATEQQAIRDQTNSIVRSILVAFRAQIDLLDWMSPASKKGAYQKIDNLVVNIAFPDWVMDDAKLADYYKNLDTAKGDGYLVQLDKLVAFSLYEDLAPLMKGAPTDRTDFSGPAATTNAWYQPQVNSITFPGGILHGPFFDAQYPAAINYGGLGVIAGHELTHGFDDEGVQWDGTGILSSWMDGNSSKSFTKMAACVVDEYSGFCPLGAGLPCVDGAQTQGENIADNGGIQAAYKAFKAYEALHGPDPLLPGDASLFTADQLFFLGFAQVWCQYPPESSLLLKQILVDPHSPSLYRVLGTLQNIPAFQKAFNCRANSTYAPSNHCDVWTSEPTSGAPVNEKGEPVVPENEINVAPAAKISPHDIEKYNAYQKIMGIFEASADLSLDPCEDFYFYSCGNYPGAQQTLNDLDQANYEIINDKLNDADYQATIAGSGALTKLKTLYDSCKVEAAHSTIATTDYLQPKVLAFRQSINQDIPLIGGTGKFDISPAHYGNVLGYLSFQLGIDTLVTPMVDTFWPDPQATLPTTASGYQLFVDQPTTYHVRAFYEDKNWNKQNDTYARTVQSLVEAYAKQDQTAVLPDGYEQMIIDALNLEKSIAITFSGTDEERRLYQRQWNPTALADFPATVDWNAYWSLAPQAAQDWVASNPIVINEKEKLMQLLDNLGNTDNANVVNYLFIRLLLANSGLIPCADGMCATAMRELSARNIPDTVGMRHRRRLLPSFHALTDDDEYGVGCVDEVSVMADAQGRVYVDARFPTKQDQDLIRSKAQGVMSNIVNAMKSMIMELDWMTEDSKTMALKKASSIQVNVAFPDFILVDEKLDDKYDDLVFADGDSYYAMLDKALVYLIGQEFKLLNETSGADRADFLGQTAIVDAWYQPELNSITFPAGILQQPFFDVNNPAALNYGGIGIAAGHELTHGFDDEGVQWDYDGRLNSWMDAVSQAGFNEMAQCVIDEYSAFCPLSEEYAPRCTDGVRTQGENIADNGGIHSAWRAYEAHVELDGPDAVFMDRVYSQYTENQLFFLNFAQSWCMQRDFLTVPYIQGKLMTDPHAIGPYRILGTAQNFPAFQANFNCPANSTYAPVQHCAVWVPSTMA